jgi:predicted  nucleic acid-binding Zn-ribbon protein
MNVLRKEKLEKYRKDLSKFEERIEAIDKLRTAFENVAKSITSLREVRKLESDKMKCQMKVEELKFLIADLEKDNADENAIS